MGETQARMWVRRIRGVWGAGVLIGLWAMALTACAGMRLETTQTWERLPPEEAVQERIRLDSRLEAAEISVVYSDGIATLEGSVESLGQKMIAEEDLYEVTGVNRVANRLVVRPPEVPDELIAQTILQSIPGYCLAGTRDVHVHVNNGDVTLSGRSNQLHHKDVIMNIAVFTTGVRSVSNRIDVDADRGDGTTTDMRIQKNVEGVLACLPVKHTRDITIRVQNGEVTLSGQLDGAADIKQVLAAVRNVPGVVNVKSELEWSKGYPYTPMFFFYY